MSVCVYFSVKHKKSNQVCMHMQQNKTWATEYGLYLCLKMPTWMTIAGDAVTPQLALWDAGEYKCS